MHYCAKSIKVFPVNEFVLSKTKDSTWIVRYENAASNNTFVEGESMKAVIIGTGRMGSRHIQVVRDLGLNLVGICRENRILLIHSPRNTA